MSTRFSLDGSVPVRTMCIFAAIGAALGGADGATAAGFREAVTFALAGGFIGAAIGLFAGRPS